MHLNVLHQVVCFLKDFFSAETQLTLNQVHNQISCLFIFYSNLFEYIYKQKNTIIVNFHQMSYKLDAIRWNSSVARRSKFLCRLKIVKKLQI